MDDPGSGSGVAVMGEPSRPSRGSDDPSVIGQDGRRIRDSAEIERLIAAFYAIFDNGGGRHPSLEAAKGLFASQARVARISGEIVETWSIDEFLVPRLEMLTNGTLTDFSEWEVAGETEIRGRMASRSSRYEKAGCRDGSPYLGRGSKLFHLARADAGWRVQHVLWEDAADELPV